MLELAVFVLAFSSTFQYSKCENTQYQNGYQYPQSMGRQVNPATGQQMDANGNPMMQGGGMSGQPMGGQTQPMMPNNGNMPTTGGNQMTPQNSMPSQPFPHHNPAMTGGNQQFPQNQQPPGHHQQYPHDPAYPGMNQHYPNEQPHNPAGGYGGHHPESPHGMQLYPEGLHAYEYILHTIESMLNNPTSRNNLYYLLNNLQMVMSNPRSTPIIQEFFNRWSRAIDTPLGQMPTNVVVQNVPSSGSFFDTLKRKGNALVNLAKDITLAKTKALNSLFDDSVFSPAIQVGTNWANAGMQAVQGTVSPFTGSTPSMTGQTIVTTTPSLGTPLTMTTPTVTVQ